MTPVARRRPRSARLRPVLSPIRTTRGWCGRRGGWAVGPRWKDDGAW